MSEPRLLDDDEIRLAFRAVLGVLPREADIRMCALLGRTDEVVADYIWDHMMGEPETIPQGDVLREVRKAVGGDGAGL